MAKYTVDEAEQYYRSHPSELRKQYSEMRHNAQKRLRRLEGTEYAESRAFKSHKEGFKKLQDIDPRDLPKAFSELSKFMDASGSSISGQKRIQQKTIERLNQAIGSDDAVNKRNYWRVVKILDEARRQKIVFGSDKIVELADATLALSKDQFDVVLENLSHFYGHTDEVLDSLYAYAGEEDLDSVDIDEFVEWTGW